MTTLRRTMAVLAVLIACTAMSVLPANAGWDWGWDWEDSPSVASVDANETAEVVTDLDADASPGSDFQTPDTTAYPAIGPYMPYRWRDSGGHPKICVDSHLSATSWPVKTAVLEWDKAMGTDGVTYYEASGNGTCASAWTDPYRIDVHAGTRTDVCSYIYRRYFTATNEVARTIVYISVNAPNCSWSVAETKIWRVVRAMGTGYGLRFHDGDGSPSVMATRVYIFPQWYDYKTWRWYN